MKRILMLLALGFLAIIMVACGTSADEEEENNADSGEEAETEVVTVEHELGETDVPKNPEKVVVFDFGILDTLDKLDVEVAGVAQATIPEYLEKYDSEDYENVGSLKEPDFEAISKIDPDLIIISNRQAEMYDELEELAPTIHLGVDTTRYMDSFIENTEIVGEIFDKEAEVDEELAKIDEAVETVNEKADEAEKNGLIILANDDKISAYGPSSRFGIIHDVLGIPAVDENIEVSVHGKNVSFEYVTEEDPDLLYVIDRSAAIGEESSAEQIVENKLMEKTKAYQNDDIAYLNPEVWYLSGGGLISVTEMIDEIGASLE